MKHDVVVAIGSLALAYIMFTWLMLHNLKVMRETKQQRLQARRIERQRRKDLYKDRV